MTDSPNDILVVDDNKPNLQLLTEILRSAGYVVRATSDPLLALQSAISSPPKLALIDVKMPVMNGYELCRRLKSSAATADVPVLFVSALKEDIDIVQGFDAGAVDYILKPIDAPLVLARIKTQLKLAQALKDLRQQQTLLEQRVEERSKALKKGIEDLEYYFSIVTKYVNIAEFNHRGKFISVSDAFCNLCGYTREELLSRSYSDLNTTDNAKIERAMLRSLRNKETWQDEVTLLCKDGSSKLVEMKVEPNINTHHDKMDFTVFVVDITYRKEIEKYATLDSLTGLHNRYKMNRILKMEVDRATRYGNPVSFISLDIDHFKRINDEFGHPAGDKVLQAFAKIFQTNIREIDRASRWGGEEFLIVCPGTSTPGAKVIAEKIQAALTQVDFSPIPAVTASFGITEYVKGDTDETILKRVDEMLYLAKSAGRNTIKITTGSAE